MTRNWTQQQYDDFNGRKHKPAPLPDRPEGTTDELKLHDEIIAWCNRQSPRIKYIHARTDRRSTIALGAHDFTLFFSGGQTICIEVKSRIGKLSTDQLAWRMEMKRLSHVVFVVRAFGEFECIVNSVLRGWTLPEPMD